MPESESGYKGIHSLAFLEYIVKTKRGIMLSSLTLYCFVFLTTYPKYLEILLDPSPINTYSYFFQKVKSPLQAVSISNDTHGSKTVFRLTIPILAKFLKIGQGGSGKDVVILYIIQSFLLFPFFIILINIIKRITEDLVAILFVIACSSVYLTKAFFWDYDFWFDGYAYFFILLGMFFRNKLGIFCSLQLACWTDERAVVALFSIYLFHLLQENNFNLYQLRQIINKNFFINNSSIIILVGLVYAVIRVLISIRFGLSTPLGEASGVGLNLIPFQFKHRLIGVFSTFEGLWLIFIAALYLMLKQKNYFSAILFSSCIFIHIIVAYSVFDITRSLTYGFPLFIASALYTASYNIKFTYYLLLVSAMICLLIPSQFLIYFPRQIPWTLLSYQELKTIIKHLFIR